MKKLIIIPDVHGRKFWIETVEKYRNNPEYHIIFLGDYLDPYVSYDHVSEEEAFEIFMQVLDVANNSNNITLLIGNHDLHYFPNFLNYWGCRRNEWRAKEISELFIKNLKLFRVAYDVEIQGKQYLFTHAGVTPEWWCKITGKQLSENVPAWLDRSKFSEEIKTQLKSMTLDARSLNQLIEIEEGQHLLNLVGRSRGGYDQTGSCMWADFYDHIDERWYDKKFYEDRYQIFSHTYSHPSTEEYYKDEYFAMLDCKKCFELDLETGELTQITE